MNDGLATLTNRLYKPAVNLVAQKQLREDFKSCVIEPEGNLVSKVAAVDLGAGGLLWTLAKLYFKIELPLLPQMAGHILAHEETMALGAKLSGLEAGIRSLDTNFFSHYGVLLNKLAPNVYKTTDLMENMGFPVATSIHLGDSIQNIITLAMPNFVLPFAGYGLIEASSRIDNKILKPAVFGFGISLAAEPILSLFGSLDHTKTSLYLLVQNCCDMVDIPFYDIDRLPFYVGAVGMTLGMYHISRPLIKKAFTGVKTIINYIKDNLIQSTPVSSY